MGDIIVERPPADERVVPGYAGKTRSGRIQRQVRDLVFGADQEKTGTCNTREVVNTVRAAPAILEEGKGRRWLHELERWSIDHCGQIATYYVWYTTDEISDQGRAIVGPVTEAEARELEAKEPAFKELRQHEVSGSETR